MSGRGRKAALPSASFRRPAALGDAVSDLVVCHTTKQGSTRSYDFGRLPAPPQLQRSLAVLFAARCTSGAWESLTTSENAWRHLNELAAFLSALDTPPTDVPDLTAGMWSAWRLSRTVRTETGYKQIMTTQLLLREDSRLPLEVRTVMARRLPVPKSLERALERNEFQAVKAAARRTLRTALLRIRENTEHLEAWLNGDFPRASRDWEIGRALDLLARTGDVPRYEYGQVTVPYTKLLGGGSPEHTWMRLFPTRTETAALGVLLVTEFGFNATTLSELTVPRAVPDSGEKSGVRVYRLELEKRRRPAGHHFESRNVTDHGADSAGRLITDVLAVTALARAYIAEHAPDVDRLLVWRGGSTPTTSVNAVGELIRVGLFGLGTSTAAVGLWAKHEGLPKAVMRRSRRTVNVVHRREPGQNSQATHDSVYVMPEPQAQEAAAKVIEAGIQEAVETAQKTVLRALLADTPQAGDREKATASCTDFEHSVFTPAGSGCGASFLLCTACPNARITPVHHPRLAYLQTSLESLRSILDPATWQADWYDAHARLEDLRQRLGDALWRQAQQQISELDRQIINDLLKGHFDT
ncbi:hypothetical protein ACWEKM_41505 [Streptomyces sp. NPDC004752]